MQVSEILGRGCHGLPVLRMSKRSTHKSDEIDEPTVSQPTYTISENEAEDTSGIDNLSRDTANEDLDREANECCVS